MSNQQKILTSPDGTKIWAEEAGNTSAPAIVLIHGLACTALGFDQQLADQELLRRLHLVRYEMRGHGRSDKPEDLESYQSVRHAEDFRTVCDAFRLNKPIVLGWSLGGCIAVDIVRYYGAESISGVMYVGGGMLSLRIHQLCRHPLFRPLVPLICSSDAQVAAKSAVPFIDSCFAKPDDMPFSSKLALVGGFGLQPPIIRHYSLIREQDDTRWRNEAKHLPVSIIQGTEDTHCLYQTLIEQARIVYGDVEVHLLEGVGHSPHLERPEETNKHILAFARRVHPAAKL